MPSIFDSLPLVNRRLGFATNSSSTHSIIVGYRGPARDVYPGDGYGWDEFILTGRKEKQNYLATLFATSSPLLWPDIKKVTGLPDPHPDSYVDHQSLMPSLDAVQNRQGVTAFIRDMVEWIMRDDVAIKGGNDNDDETPLDEEYGYSAISLRHLDIAEIRKEREKTWTIFDPRSGTRETFDFNSTHPHDLRHLSTPTPLLVDMKITDYCDTGCAYCYQGSTPEGKHAPLQDILTALDTCAAMRVLEVAFGGGEPLKHPQFATILRECRARGIVPNFTTRELGWLDDREMSLDILKNVGAFAFSVDSAADVERLIEVVYRRRRQRDEEFPVFKTHIQYVVGSRPAKTRRAIMKAVQQYWGMPLTLLGYKTTGRGEAARRHADKTWLKDALELDGLLVGIDTCLAAEAEEELKTAKIPPYMYQTREGYVSMYWDCVTGMMGPSSFAPDRMRPVPPTTAEVQALYQTFKQAGLPVIS